MEEGHKGEDGNALEKGKTNKEQESHSFYVERLCKRKTIEEKRQEQKQKETGHIKKKMGKKEKKAEKKEAQLQEKEKKDRTHRTQAKLEEGAKKIVWIEMCYGTAPFTNYMLGEYKGKDCRAVLIDIRPANELHLQVQIDDEYIHFWQA